MFFNISSPFSAVGFNTINMTDSYFGVSHLIEVFKYLPNTELGRYANTVNKGLNTVSGLMTRFFSEGVSNFFDSYLSIFSSGNFFQFLLNTIVMVANYTGMLLKITASVLLGAVALMLFIAYLVLMVVNILTFIGFALGSMYHSAVPTYPSMDIQPYIMQSVNSVLTSLKACC